MLRLHTLGGLWIEADPAPTPLGPRRMGLLAIVAAAGRKGISRDRVLGILWAESAEDPARHTLAQNLYAMRRQTECDVIVATGRTLRLGPGVTSDIGDLHEALAGGDERKAIDLYTGDFLEGFYLPGVAEFERWVEEERSRIRSSVIRAHEHLARQADAANDGAEAVRLWRRLTELDSLSARHTLGLMRALAAHGDRPAALACARAYEDRVRRELESEPDPSIRELVATLRKRERSTPIAPSAPAPTTVNDPAPADALAIDASIHHDGAAVAVGGAPSAGRRTRRRVWVPAVAVVLTLAAAAGLRSMLGGAASVPPLLAVGTIRVVGSDTAGLGPVFRDMLATTLGAIPGLRVIANSRLVELAGASTDDPAGLNDAAQRAGAGEVLEGEIGIEGSELTLNLRRVSLAGVVNHGHVIHAADRFALADSAATVIARDFGLTAPAGNLAERRTLSIEAYALYEEGLRAYYIGESATAMRLMEAALEYDSTFAMAAYYAWQASRNSLTGEELEQVRMRARRLAPRSIERERLLIEGSVSEFDAPFTTMLAIAETLAVRYPDDADGHMLVGAAKGLAGDWAGSIAALDRVVVLDSTAGIATGPLCRVCTALAGAGTQYLWWDSAGAAERTAMRLIALRPDRPNGWGLLIEPLLRQARRDEAGEAARRMEILARSAGDPRFHLHRDLIRRGRYDDLERELSAMVRSPSQITQSQARWLWLFALRDQGRLREANDLARGGVIPGGSSRIQNVVPDITQLAIIALENGEALESAIMFRRIAASLKTDSAVGTQARNLTWYLTLAGTALAAAGDTSAVRALADTVEFFGRRSSFGRDPRLHHFLRGLILQSAARHADAVALFERSLFSTTDGYTRINLAMARSLLELGRADEAIAILQPVLRGGIDGSNTYLTRTDVHELLGEAFTAAGMADSARIHYAAVERALRKADPVFRPRYERARTAMMPGS